jgi:hypothetical protein
MSDGSSPISSLNGLLESFRPSERQSVVVPYTMRFPLTIDPYLTWGEPSGVRVYLVYFSPRKKGPLGVIFRRDQQGSAGSPPGMCEWCLSTGSSDQIGLLTAESGPNRRVGVNLCLDLGCIVKLEVVSNVSGIDLDRLRSMLLQKIDRFFREALDL